MAYQKTNIGDTGQRLVDNLDSNFSALFAAISEGSQGPKGANGWTPTLALASDGERRVLRVTDWTGGEGPKPEIGYIGAGGIVTGIASAVDIRGSAGTTGATGGQGPQGEPGRDGADMPVVNYEGLNECVTPGMVIWDATEWGMGVFPVLVVDASAAVGETYIVQYMFDNGYITLRFLYRNVWSEWEPLKSGQGESQKVTVKGRGIMFLGDSNSQDALSVKSIGSLTSDSSGTVTISFPSAHSYLPGDRIKIINASPLEFNGSYSVASVPGSATITTTNTKVAPNSTAAADWTQIGAIMCAQQINAAAHYIYYGIAGAGMQIPIYDIFALSSTTLKNWAGRLGTYVFPTGVEYVHILLGGNDVSNSTDNSADVIESYKNLIDGLILRGVKPVAGTVQASNREVNSYFNANARAVNVWLKAYCAKRNIPVIDYYSALVDGAGVPIASYYQDNVHFSAEGHRAVGAVLAAALKTIFADNELLPISSLQNFSAGVNMFSDPLITKTPVSSTQSGVTGVRGAETVVSLSGGGTAVSSIVPREDGNGNDVQVVATISSAYIDYTTASANVYTASEPCVAFPVCDVMASGGTVGDFRASWTFTKNEAAPRTISIIPTTTGFSRIGVFGNPVFLAAGDRLSDCSMLVRVRGSGVVTAKLGRVMLRIMPLSEWNELRGKLESEGASSMPLANVTDIGGIRAKAKTTETAEIAIDPATGRLYAPSTPAGQVAFSSITGQPGDNAALSAALTALENRIDSIVDGNEVAF